MDAFFSNYEEIVAMLLFGIGFTTLMFHRNLVKKIIGLNIMDTAVYLFLASMGYIEGGMAPIVPPEGAADASLYVNPIPAGLVLTGIVVSVSVSAFSLALIQRIHGSYGTVDMRVLLAEMKKREE